uniref:Secreted protein n=1 Tax=Caenorhabditis tropicalis TaxID=1561998 RepID=A0A1I7UZ14_9PELO
MKLIIVLFFFLSSSSSMAWRINKGNSISEEIKEIFPMVFRVERANPTDEEKNSVVNVFNEGRRGLAKSGQGAANMNKLKWSDSVSFPTGECNFETTVPVKNGEELMGLMIDEDLSNLKANHEIISKLADQSIFNCLNPKQTAIQCKEIPCIINSQSMPIPYCICGPERGLQEEDFVLGTAGSKCPGAVDDGLCVDPSI